MVNSSIMHNGALYWCRLVWGTKGTGMTQTVWDVRRKIVDSNESKDRKELIAVILFQSLGVFWNPSKALFSCYAPLFAPITYLSHPFLPLVHITPPRALLSLLSLCPPLHRNPPCLSRRQLSIKSISHNPSGAHCACGRWRRQALWGGGEPQMEGALSIIVTNY